MSIKHGAPATFAVSASRTHSQSRAVSASACAESALLSLPPVPQSSGVQCNPECLAEFDKMKIRSEYSYIVFKITDDKKFIEIEHKGAKGADFAEFCSKLPEADCRYAVLDVEINTKAGATANKLIFVAW